MWSNSPGAGGPIIRELCDAICGRVSVHQLHDGRILFSIKTENWQSNAFGSAHALESHCFDILSGFLTRNLELGGAQ